MTINIISGNYAALPTLDTAMAALGVVVGVMLWSVNQRAFVFLWIYFGLFLARVALRILSLYVVEESHNIESIGPALRSLIPLVIWFLYFKQSDRVQATFGRNL